MIYSLTGSLAEVSEDYIVVNVNGVGYQVYIHSRFFKHPPSLNSTIMLFTHFYVREDQQILFGFSNSEEKIFFTLVTSLSGIGPKVGLKILSSLSFSQFSKAILSEDIFTLTQIPTVGKKMAERMILELKDKISKLSLEHLSSYASSPEKSESTEDIVLALKSLGYSQEEIRKAIQKSSNDLTPGLSVEAGLKIALRHLA